MLDLEEIFGHGGPLERALPDFRVRRGQLLMAQRVADALAARESLVVEAGTGTGKTFAYLVPALLCGARVLISTGTRTLQDQLFSKDLPLVAAALGRPARVALARREAFDADIVIVNHHLLLADLALKEDGFGDLLGSADAVILDEAHQIPDLATQFFGAHVSSRQLELLLRDLGLELSKHAQLAGAATGEAATVQRAAEALRAPDETPRDL